MESKTGKTIIWCAMHELRKAAYKLYGTIHFNCFKADSRRWKSIIERYEAIGQELDIYSRIQACIRAGFLALS